MAVCLTCLGLSGGCTSSARQLQGTIWALIHLRAAQNRAWQHSSFEWGGGRVQFDHAFQTRCPGYLKGPVIYFRHSHGVEQGATCTFDGRLPRAMGAHAAPSGPAKALVGRSCARRQQNGAHIITLVWQLSFRVAGCIWQLGSRGARRPFEHSPCVQNLCFRLRMRCTSSRGSVSALVVHMVSIAGIGLR